MKELFKDLKEDKIIFRGSIISLGLILLSILYISFFYNRLPPFIPLFNQMPWGEDRITKTIWIFLVPFISLAFFGVNILVARKVRRGNALISRLYSFMTFLIAVLSFLFIIRTINAAF